MNNQHSGLLHPKTAILGTALFIAWLASHQEALAQGCVAIRGGSCAGTLHGLGTDPHHGFMDAGDWQFSLGYRWLHSDKHFVGDEEQKHRQDLGNEVINDSHFFDVGIQYAFNSRFSAGLVIPFVHSDRSSLYEFSNRGRHESSAGGLGDVRLMGYAWLWDPKEEVKGNILLGIGPKFPTGDHKATDTFIDPDGNSVIGYVDQSIQPGDGGWGIMTEIFAYRQIFDRTSLYLQGAYLFNPEEENGTPTRTGRPRGNPYEQVMSITDQYLGRAGVNYAVWPEKGLALSLGGRIEGVPVRDAIGGNDGFRRPGYAVSIEPGVSWMKSGWSVAVTTPVAVYRNRERSVADIRLSEDTGTYRHGDAAFADWTINASVAFRW